MVDEAEFTQRALEFVAEFVEGDIGELTADTDLRDVEGLDSLFLVSFLQFLENERGASLPISPDTGIPVESVSSVRQAYTTLVVPAA